MMTLTEVELLNLLYNKKLNHKINKSTNSIIIKENLIIKDSQLINIINNENESVVTINKLNCLDDTLIDTFNLVMATDLSILLKMIVCKLFILKSSSINSELNSLLNTLNDSDKRKIRVLLLKYIR